MSYSHYGIAVIDAASGQEYHENSRALFETMSGIKSVIGTLALEAAAVRSHDIAEYTVSVTRDHDSNGSGELKRLLASQEQQICLPLESVISLSTAASDCVATNALIDYLDGPDSVNGQIRKDLGLPGMELVTERLHFPGVNHVTQPFQVAKATMLDFARYYQMIWSEDSNWRPRSSAHEWFKHEHYKVSTARLFNRPQDTLPADVTWAHKTGSGTDITETSAYAAMMDAGMLRVDGRELFVAAARTVLQSCVTDGVAIVAQHERQFAERNTAFIESVGVPITEALRRSVAA